MLHQIGQDVLHVVDGEGEAQALGGHAGAGLGILGGDDAHHVAIAVKQGAARVAGVDGAVGLQHVQGGAHRLAVGVGAAGGDQPVQGGDDAVGEGVGQLAQGVADGIDALAHHQLAGIAQGDGGQAGGIDLQHGHVVVLLAAHQLGGVLVAVGEGHLHRHGGVVGRLLNDVVVGDDVAVLGEDKAGAGGRRGGGLAEDVHRGGGDGDAHAGAQVGGIQLLGSHGLAAVAVHHGLDLGVLHRLVNGGGTGAVEVAVQGRAAHARAAAYDGTGQDQSCDALAAALFTGGLPGLDRSAASGDGVAVVTKAAPVSVVLAVIKIEVVHTGQTPLKFLSYFGFPLELWI